MAEIINRIGRNVSKILNFSPDILTRDISITIHSGYQAIIDGYSKILEYNDNILRISKGNARLRIIGSNLILSEISQDGLIVEGKIYSAEFENHGGQTLWSCYWDGFWDGANFRLKAMLGLFLTSQTNFCGWFKNKTALFVQDV